MSAQSVTGDVVVKPGTVRERVHEGLEDVQEKATTLYRRGKDKAREWENQLEDEIREKPIQSVLVAAGVGAGLGLVLGVMLARR